MFDGRYLDWNQKRIKGILDFYGHKFMYYKKILDLGCGHADISGVLHRLGADITAVDARQEHLRIASKKYPGIKTIKADLDINWPFHGKSFDLILDLDLICHLSNYEQHLKNVCAATDHLILETTVADSNDPHFCSILTENKAIYDLSVNGVSCRPSAAAIERILLECGMSFKRQDNMRYNSHSYCYDWENKNNQECNVNKRRLWFVVKNTSAIKFAPSVENVVSAPRINNINNSGTLVTLQDTQIPVVNSLKIISAPLSNRSIIEDKKIKTALCISGHLRTFEENFYSVRNNILSKLDCDVFIHTWDTLGTYRHTDSIFKNLQTHKSLERIKSLFNPKNIIVEPSKIFAVTPLIQQRVIDHRDVPGILSMFYKIEACNELKKQYETENNFIYDCVIRFRSDINMGLELPINQQFNSNYLYVPTYGHFGGLCDQIAYGGSKIMDMYSSLYSNINKYMMDGAPMHPEKLLKHHIDKQQITYSKVNIKFTIKRANGLIQDNFLLEKALGFIK